MIDSNDTVFKYNKKANVYSMIEADYLMEKQYGEQKSILFCLMMKEIIIFAVHFPGGKDGLFKKSSFVDTAV